ncbi:glycosyltransferase [Paenibacillus favisporus]|uniref:glycosyltransferase n=1 Tax=Paenibacillus favisporus TaxID=221028 RepID=UPI0013D1B0B2|nr:glycosyltransferase [Paenibacillus favisporus]
MKETVPTIEIWDNVAKTYEVVINDTERQLASEIKKIFDEMGISFGGKLFELGCGSGHLSAVLAQSGFDVSLLDFSPVALEKAKNTFEVLGLNGEFIQGDLLDIELISDEEYDVAWNSGVMEHFDETSLSKAFESISKINAKFYVFIVPNPNSIPYLLFRYKLMSSGEWIWGKEFLRKNYSGLLAANGFSIIKESFIGASFSEDHLNYILGNGVEIPFKDLVDYGLISPTESYLKVYIAKRDSKHLIDSKIDRTLVDIDQLKTEIFDLSCQVNLWKTKFIKSAEEVEQFRNEIVNSKNEISKLVNILNIYKEEIESFEKSRIDWSEKQLNYEGKLDILKKELYLLKEEKENLQKELDFLIHQKNIESEDEKNNHKLLLEAELMSYQEIVNNRLGIIKERLINVANTKPFRFAYYLRRFKFEFLKGNLSQKKNFIKWNFNKLIGRTTIPNYDYHLLLNISSQLNQINFNNISAINYQTNNFNAIDILHNTLKTQKSVFIFGTVPFYDIGGGQRSAQLAKTFDKMGYLVNYIYAFEASDGSNKQNIFLPLIMHSHVDNILEADIINRLTVENIFIFEAPIRKFEYFLQVANKFKIPVVYEHIDNWETSLGDMFFDLESYRNFINNSDYITATSILLKEKLSDFISKDDGITKKNIVIDYLPNAVDNDLFESLIKHEKPADLRIGKKTVLYYGSLWGEWFDWSYVSFIALKRPDYQINLIGDFATINIAEFPKNIHFLGLKKQTELPAYLQYSDIAIIPFKNDDIGKYVSPLKIFEYISMGKKVVSTALPDIAGYPNVYISDEKEKWLELIDNDDKLQDFDVFVLQNNWYSRCRKIIDSTLESVNKSNRISIIILNRNNKKTIIRCVESLLFYNSYDYEIIVVDNQSTDGSYEALEDKFGEKIKLFKNSKNGCSSGRNLGARRSSGELLFFLDSDQWIIEDKWLDNALDILASRKDVGAVGWNAGWFNDNSVEGPIVDYYENRAIKPSELYRTDITYLATSGLLMTKTLFEDINGFDEYYDPTCFEDTDLSFSIRNLGYKLAYCPYMGIFHLPHQTTNSGSVEHKKRMKKNGDYFIEKWKAINHELF